jgi:hypothetical protein
MVKTADRSRIGLKTPDLKLVSPRETTASFGVPAPALALCKCQGHPTFLFVEIGRPVKYRKIKLDDFNDCDLVFK